MTRAKTLLIAFALFFPVLSHALSRIPPWATAVGTITSIDAEQKLIRIVSDSVAIDVTAAAFHRADPMGPAITFADLAPGMLISADIIPGNYQLGEPLRSNLILVLMHTNGQFDGLVSSVDVASSSFTMLGKAFRVNERTVFATTLGGPPPDGIEDLVAGQHVLLEFNHNGNELEARKITIVDSATSPLVTFSGDAYAINGDVLSISGPRVTAIRITPQTQVTGTLQVPSRVSGTATFENGIYVAITLTFEPRQTTETFEGTVARIEGDRGHIWTIALAGQTTREVHVEAQTILGGGPTIGSYVRVTVDLRPGAPLALAIVVVEPSEPPLQIAHLGGRIAELTATTLVITEAGLTQKRLTVTPETTFEGDPHVGDTVTVEAQLLTDGTLRAVRVMKVASAPAQLTIVGRVMRTNGDRWIVGRWSVLISPRTTISGDVETGDRVRVIGERQSDTKYVVAHSIYKE